MDRGHASGSLIAEGLLIRNALLYDLLERPGNTVTVLQDERLGATGCPDTPRLEVITVSSAHAFDNIWQAQLARCDAVWPIAPETDGILERLCRDVAASPGLLLNSPAHVVEITRSKHQTLAVLARHGLHTVPTTQVIAPATTPFDFPVVVKPDDGVGCVGSRVLGNATEWRHWFGQAEWRNCVVQPFINGESRSLSALFAEGQALLLSCNRQHIRVVDGRFELESCTVNLTDCDRTAAMRLAAAVAAALPGLWGYAGIDFIDSDDVPRVLEINPRLTTSYIGLRQALGINVAALVQDLATSGRLPSEDMPRGAPVRIDIGRLHVH